MFFLPPLFCLLHRYLVKPKPSISEETSEQKQQRMAWWTHDCLGMFIHWALYSGVAKDDWIKESERSNEQYH